MDDINKIRSKFGKRSLHSLMLYLNLLVDFGLNLNFSVILLLQQFTFPFLLFQNAYQLIVDFSHLIDRLAYHATGNCRRPRKRHFHQNSLYQIEAENLDCTGQNQPESWDY